MNKSVLKICSYYQYSETGSSHHRWLPWVLLVLLLTNPSRDSREPSRPQGPPALCSQVGCREKCMTAACRQPARSSWEQINCLNSIAVLCQAANCAQLCSGCTTDPIPTMPILPECQSREQLGFREWLWVSHKGHTDSAVFVERKTAF